MRKFLFVLLALIVLLFILIYAFGKFTCADVANRRYAPLGRGIDPKNYYPRYVLECWGNNDFMGGYYRIIDLK